MPGLTFLREKTARMELWSVLGSETGTRAVLFSMAAEAGGLKPTRRTCFVLELCNDFIPFCAELGPNYIHG